MKLKKGIVHANELLCSIYILFQSVVLIFNEKFSSNTTNFVVIGLLLLLLFIVNRKNLKISKYLIFITIIVQIVFLYTLIFHYNNIISYYIKSFVLNGFLTMVFFNYVKDYKILMKYISYICILIFIFSATDPFNNYQKYGNYMSYGFSCVMPCFMIFHIQRKYNGNKFFLPFEILSFCLLIYSNRNSILSSVVLVLLLDVFVKKTSVKKIIKYMGVICLISLFLINVKSIFNVLQNNFGNNSYAIRSLYYWIEGKTDGLSGRDELWNNSLIEIQEHPIFGIGIGTFQEKYGNYCHNIFLEFIVSMGILGLMLIILLFFKTFQAFKANRNNIFFYYITIIGVFPLLFNNSFFRWKYYWIFLLFIFKNSSKTESIISQK